MNSIEYMQTYHCAVKITGAVLEEKFRTFLKKDADYDFPGCSTSPLSSSKYPLYFFIIPGTDSMTFTQEAHNDDRLGALDVCTEALSYIEFKDHYHAVIDEYSMNH